MSAQFRATPEVVIIGAGVSGSSTAIRLLQAGIRPLVIDQATFPRDIVGEGLSPAVGPYLEELGIVERVDSGPFLKKKSLQIVAPNGDVAYTEVNFERKFYKDGLHHFPWGYNVQRRYFDQVFFERAKELGANIRLQTAAKRYELDEKGTVTGVWVEDKDGRESLIPSSLVIDCSGRSSVLARQLQLRAPLAQVFEGQWANFAVRLHFSKVNYKPLIRDNPNYDLATVNIIPGHDCWYWFVPIYLEPELISVGFVARSKVQKIFDGYTDKIQAYRDLIARHPVLREVIKDAEVSDNIVVTSRLGHMNTRMSGAGFMCVGDAAFFADPAWATGVTIALRTSKMAAEAAVRAVRAQDFSEEFLAEYERNYRDWVCAPFNSIRAYNYYYNDIPYVNYLVRRLAEIPEEMDMIGAVLFDYASHEEFLDWGFRVYKAYLHDTGKLPVVDKVSQFDFDGWQGGEQGQALNQSALH